MDKQVIDNIVWCIPFRKLRDNVRYLLLYLINYIDNEIEKENQKNIPIDQQFANFVASIGEPHIAPIGHYESPYPPKNELLEGYKNLNSGKHFMYDFKALNMNDEIQLQLYEKLKEFFKNCNFSEEKDDKNRFYYNNVCFRDTCATYLFSIINYFKPKNIIEIGSGFSTALMLDINNNIFNNSINILSIEPYPSRLESLLLETDNLEIIKENQQKVSLEVFKKLDENDLLFIDSSHVCRQFGDINRQFFDILPSLKKGVIIHIHDIFYPFEYPKQWVYDRRMAFTEAYMLRAFLQYNDSFEIICFPNYLKYKYPDKVKIDSNSIYLKKVK